jgi:hypothetical protein
MSTSPTDKSASESAVEEVADTEQEKESQVLGREGLETELMDDDRSGVGEEVAGVEDE